jgi:hypothetical protein
MTAIYLQMVRDIKKIKLNRVIDEEEQMNKEKDIVDFE